MAEPMPFQSRAMYYHELGLNIVPIRRDTKRPATRWQHLQGCKQSRKQAESWMEKFASHNIGLVTGRGSGITVVDSDNPTICLSDLMDRFGHTEFATRTPRGGHHLYYRSNDEPSITGYETGLDIRGNGGIIICPPSFNSDGKGYLPAYGNELDPRDLTTMVCITTKSGYSLKAVSGQRNNELFTLGCQTASGLDSYEQLLAFLEQKNASMFYSGLSSSEVRAMAKKIWEYKQRGKLYRIGHAHIPILTDLHQMSPAANKVYVYLRGKNNFMNRDFQVSAKACACLLGMSPTTFRKTLEEMMAGGIIIKTHSGGDYVGDVARYQWGQ